MVVQNELAKLPIGVFDSGLGGLSVLGDLCAEMPSESFVYLGDVARLPYGTKSSQVVKKYAQSCVRFLKRQPVKLVVVACNTATAHALEDLRKADPSLNIFGVISPGVQAALQVKGASKKVLVLATPSTVASQSYLNEFRRQSPETPVQQIACPLLVPLAEEGWFDTEVTAQVIRHYLKGIDPEEFQTVLLGCTHYPFLEPSFRTVLGEKVNLVRGSLVLAKEISATLEKAGLKNPQEIPGALSLFSTDAVPHTLPMITKLLRGAVPFSITDLS